MAKQQVIEVYREPTQKLMAMATGSLRVATLLGSMRWQLLPFRGARPCVLRPAGRRLADRDCCLHETPPTQPRLRPLEALEVRAPLSAHLAILMTWADREDGTDPVEAQPTLRAR